MWDGVSVGWSVGWKRMCVRWSSVGWSVGWDGVCGMECGMECVWEKCMGWSECGMRWSVCGME